MLELHLLNIHKRVVVSLFTELSVIITTYLFVVDLWCWGLNSVLQQGREVLCFFSPIHKHFPSLRLVLTMFSRLSSKSLAQVILFLGFSHAGTIFDCHWSSCYHHLILDVHYTRMKSLIEKTHNARLKETNTKADVKSTFDVQSARHFIFYCRILIFELFSLMRFKKKTTIIWTHTHDSKLSSQWLPPLFTVVRCSSSQF